MAQRAAAYVPIMGDHWLCTEWSSVRKRLPMHDGTEAEAKRRLYDRVRFLTGRGWRVVTQKLSDDMAPGKRRMLVRVEPPTEYAHCGESVIEYRSCGGPTWCKPCRIVQTEQEAERRIYGPPELDADADRARCQPDFEAGVCRACGRGLRDHLPRYTREAVAAFHHEGDVSTSRQSEGV